MGRSRMKIGVLTSSRADFGIYSPLLEALSKDSFFELHIIAFGTHLSEKHGATVSEIEAKGFKRIHKIQTLVMDTGALAISRSYSDVTSKFAEFWNSESFDIVLTLGDRYEMSAAVQASIPYRIVLAHIHGGEQTLGAIDNIYRHQISLASTLHFTAAEQFSDRLSKLLENTRYIYNVGSLSIVDLPERPSIEESEFRGRYSLSNKPFVLCTFHPETDDYTANFQYVEEMTKALRGIPEELDIIVTMPNADTNGNIYREALNKLKSELNERLTLIESFGKVNYFAALNYCEFVLGNSSSGIIEAASFNKYVINVGDRQKGRLRSENVIDVAFQSDAILEAIDKLMLNSRNFLGKNEYAKENTVQTVIDVLRKFGNGEI